jgi:hypothetical protein
MNQTNKKNMDIRILCVKENGTIIYMVMSAHHKFTLEVVRVSGYRSRGPRFDSQRFQIFSEAAGLEWGPLSLVRTTEELLEGKSSGSGLENRD